MSLKSLLFTESYYFHVYVVCCDVHFRYNDDAFKWTAYNFPKKVNEARTLTHPHMTYRCHIPIHKVSNVNEVAHLYVIVLIPLVCCDLRCTLSL